MRRTASVVLAALIPAPAAASSQDGFRIDLDYGEIEKIRVDPLGGKILIGGTFNLGGLPGDRVISRHHPNGERDASFNTTSFIPPNGRIFSFARLSSEQILVGGDFSGAGYPANLALLQPNGVWDNSLNLQVNGTVRVIEDFLTNVGDAETYVGGAFTQAAGLPRAGLFRIDRNEIDEDWTPAPLTGTVRAIARQSNGALLVGGSFLEVAGATKGGTSLVRLFPDGSHDDSFNFATGEGVGVFDHIHTIAIQRDGKILVGGSFTVGSGSLARTNFARLLPNGDIDPTFAIDGTLDGPVHDVAIQADGRAIIVGGFDNNGAVNSKFARLNHDGSRENDFSRRLEPNQSALSVEVQGDGGILIAGKFSIVGPVNAGEDDRPGAFRILKGKPRILNNLRNLGLDRDLEVSQKMNDSFGSAIGGTTSVLEADGNFLIRSLSSVSLPTGTANVLRVSGSDGNPLLGYGAHLGRDALSGESWNQVRSTPPVAGVNHEAMRMLEDGRVLIAGTFTEVNGENIRGVVILNPDGTRDISFNPPEMAGLTPSAPGVPRTFTRPFFADVDYQGRVYVAGVMYDFFSDDPPFTFQSSLKSGVYRLHPDGTLDSTFRAGSSLPFQNTTIGNVFFNYNNRPTAMAFDWDRRNLYLARGVTTVQSPNPVRRYPVDGRDDWFDDSDPGHRLEVIQWPFQQGPELDDGFGKAEIWGMSPRPGGDMIFFGDAKHFNTFIGPTLAGSLSAVPANGAFVLSENGEVLEQPILDYLPLDMNNLLHVGEKPHVVGTYRDRRGGTLYWGFDNPGTTNTDSFVIRTLPNGNLDPNFAPSPAMAAYLGSPGFIADGLRSLLSQQADGKYWTTFGPSRFGNLGGIPRETLVRTTGSDVHWVREFDGPSVAAPPRLWISFEGGSDAVFQPLPGEMIFQSSQGGRWVYPGLPDFSGTYYLKVRAMLPDGTGFFETPVHQFGNAAAPPPVADLSVWITPSNPQPMIGDQLELDIFIHNNGPFVDAPNVAFEALLPDGLAYVTHRFLAGGIADDTYNPATGKAELGEMHSGMQIHLRIIVEVLNWGDRHLKAEVIGNVNDPDLSNNVAQIILPRLMGNSDLDVAITASPTAGTLEDDYTFTVNVTNHGPGPAYGVEVSPDLFLGGRGFIADPATSTIPSPSFFTSSSSSSVRWRWQRVNEFTPSAPVKQLPIQPGATRSLTFTATPDDEAGRFHNLVRVAVSSASPDPDLSNNISEVQLLVEDPNQSSNLVVTIENLTPDAQPGEFADFLIIVQNMGPDPAINPYVVVSLPSGYEYVSLPTTTLILGATSPANPQFGTYYSASGLWRITGAGFGLNPAGSTSGVSSAGMVLRGLVLPEGDYDITAYASSNSTETDPGTATQSITLVPSEGGAYPLKIVSIETISPTEREITLSIIHPGPGDPQIMQSTDLANAGSWSPVNDAIITSPTGQPNLREIRFTRPLTTKHLFFRSTIQP